MSCQSAPVYQNIFLHLSSLQMSYMKRTKHATWLSYLSLIMCCL
ncbi:unnamed protein product, partial [Staurois parvus]